MKLYGSLCASLCVLLASAGALEARINVFQLWQNGQDSMIAPLNAYAGNGSVIIAEHEFDIPVQLTYIALPKLETGLQWGARYFDGVAGISDLALGAKYQLLDGTGQNPAVIGEAAVSLPTADSRKNLGTGAVAFLLHWALEKKITDVTAYFGLGAQINGENSDDMQAGNIFFYHAGAGYDYAKDLRLYGELKGFNHGKTKLNGTELDESNIQELYLSPGADYTFRAFGRSWDVSGALLIGLTSESKDFVLSFTTRL